ncbi:MAG: Putative cytokinin riboside 5'-monophosphate phosphoribohydrolase [Candidatus Celerinatantimonas neptuna]|nr:MAG: Putative cytokinin riboside 5'-monophosphate phosphoribohydrolase [Candidatus Celerinatantimonas neptuna]
MKVAVFCGSSLGDSPVFRDAAIRLGKYLAKQKIDLVYGGSQVGLMGIIADTVLEQRGCVYGVIPEKLKDKELAHTGLTELIIVSDMHQRKAKMAELSDAFIAMPGGAGTLEEISEAWTWAQLGYHTKPCCFYNIDGFFSPLLDMFHKMVTHQFMKVDYTDMLINEDQPEALITSIRNYRPPQKKWP